jgi:hypothetical protein
MPGRLPDAIEDQPGEDRSGMIEEMRTKTAVVVCALMLAACGHSSSPQGSRGLRAGCRAVANAEKKNAENVMAGLKNHGSSRSPSPRHGC